MKMSDWEDEYSADGVAIQKPATKSAPPEWNLPCDDRHGVRNESRVGAPREWRADRGGEGSEYRSRRGGGEGRPFTRNTDRGRQTFGDEKSDSSPPVTITVENASVGRVIGRFLK